MAIKGCPILWESGKIAYFNKNGSGDRSKQFALKLVRHNFKPK